MFTWPDVFGLLLGCAITYFLARWFNHEVAEEVSKKQTQGDINALAEKAKKDVDGANIHELGARIDEKYRKRGK